MPATFPTLSGGYSLTSYPADRSVSMPVEVVRFISGAEQRWRSGPALNAWQFTLRLNAIDLATVITFFDTVKGAYDTTWTFPFDGSTYTNCVFETDEFTFQRRGAPNIYHLDVRVRQCRQSVSLPTAPAAYPAINGGVITQLPYSEIRRWNTSTNRMANGRQYSWSNWNAPRRAWQLNYPVITYAEAFAILDAYMGAGGAWGTFDFTDPRNGSTYTARFSGNELGIKYQSLNQCSMAVALEEVP